MPKDTSKLISSAEYGSDYVVDLLKILNIEYVTLNPGATFRGLHDSLVNYGENHNPETILCTHEETAVSIADGYGRAAGKPMVAIVHNVVGLLHSSMAIFNAWVDRAGIIVLGGTGPVATDKRRPWIDWIHTASVQGNAVRDFVKWDDQPASISSIADSLLRATQIATSDPMGPVYICIDAELQEQKLNEPLRLPDPNQYASPSAPNADPKKIDEACEILINAKKPIAIVDYIGKDQESIQSLVDLAEQLSLPVLDLGSLLNFPTEHQLNITGSSNKLINEADAILALNVFDLEEALTTVNQYTRETLVQTNKTSKLIDVSLRHYSIRGWLSDYGKLMPADISIASETTSAINGIKAGVSNKIHANKTLKRNIDIRKKSTVKLHEELRSSAIAQATTSSHEHPISLAFLSHEVWKIAKDYDWVLTSEMRGWLHKIWDIKHSYQYVGSRGGGGLGRGIGRSIGVALANKNSKRICINFQADGDMLFADSALWTAAHHKIPLLIIMYNNRSYYNDEEHQAIVAKERERSVDNRVVGIRLENPEVNFGALAKSFGIYGEGPIENPEKVAPAIKRALKVVSEKRCCALVDVITQNR